MFTREKAVKTPKSSMCSALKNMTYGSDKTKLADVPQKQSISFGRLPYKGFMRTSHLYGSLIPQSTGGFLSLLLVSGGLPSYSLPIPR